MKAKNINNKSFRPAKDFKMKDIIEHEIETLMTKYDSEKRESDYLDEMIRNFESDLKSAKGPKRIESPMKNPLLVKIMLLEKQIKYETAQYDTLKNKNFEIRQEINQLRLENTAYKKSLARYSAMIQSSSYTAINVNKKKRDELATVMSHKNRISEIRSRSLISNKDYSVKVRELSTIIKEKSNISVNYEQNYQLEQLLKNLKGCNISKIQKNLNEKWENLVQKTKDEIEVYKKYIKGLKLGFDDIKNALGIQKIPDIVNVFIKSQEQIHSLYKYLSLINSQIDELEGSFKENEKKMEFLKLGQLNEEKQGERLVSIRSKAKDIETKISENHQEINLIEKYISKCSVFIKDLTEKLKPFNLKGKKFFETQIGDDEAINLNLALVDELIEKIIAIINMKSPRNSRNLSSFNEKSRLNTLSVILEQKDLYQDENLDELKQPLSSNDFLKKANKIINT